ncbi:alpha/beta-hydrolase, partial [Paxillus ammoniavirescens]
AGVGNLGLQDERLALYLVLKYVGAFGGDPTKVTIWGESPGAMSVALQLVTNGGDPDGLFRAAFMRSGSPILSHCYVPPDGFRVYMILPSLGLGHEAWSCSAD